LICHAARLLSCIHLKVRQILGIIIQIGLDLMIFYISAD